MKKSLETRMDAISFHMFKAEELVREWWEQREAMGRSMQTMDESTDFFIEVATESVRTERRYMSQIRYHRNKAKRLIRKYEKHPLKLQSSKDDEDVLTPVYPDPDYTPYPPFTEPRN